MNFLIFREKGGGDGLGVPSGGFLPLGEVVVDYRNLQRAGGARRPAGGVGGGLLLWGWGGPIWLLLFPLHRRLEKKKKKKGRKGDRLGVTCRSPTAYTDLAASP